MAGASASMWSGRSRRGRRMTIAGSGGVRDRERPNLRSEVRMAVYLPRARSMSSESGRPDQPSAQTVRQSNGGSAEASPGQRHSSSRNKVKQLGRYQAPETVENALCLVTRDTGEVAQEAREGSTGGEMPEQIRDRDTSAGEDERAVHNLGRRSGDASERFGQRIHHVITIAATTPPGTTGRGFLDPGDPHHLTGSNRDQGFAKAGK